MPPVPAYHLILTAYGFWLPNDPRGSWSDFVRAWELTRFGDATKVATRRSLAKSPHNRSLRLEAKQSLVRDAVCFNGRQAIAIADGFHRWSELSGGKIFACSILPEHVHLVIARHRFKIERVANLLKGEATKSLARAGMHPFQDVFYRDGTRPSPWTRKWWKVFLTTDADISRAIKYVERNPVKEGKRGQKWLCTTEFNSGP
jgi:REP element-mobilizing transposase RayT